MDVVKHKERDVALRIGVVVKHAADAGYLRSSLVENILIHGIAERFRSEGDIKSELRELAARVAVATHTTPFEQAFQSAKALRKLIESLDEQRNPDKIISHVRDLGTILLTINGDPRDILFRAHLRLTPPSGLHYTTLLRLADSSVNRDKIKKDLFEALGLVMESCASYPEAINFYVRSIIPDFNRFNEDALKALFGMDSKVLKNAFDRQVYESLVRSSIRMWMRDNVGFGEAEKLTNLLLTLEGHDSPIFQLDLTPTAPVQLVEEAKSNGVKDQDQPHLFSVAGLIALLRAAFSRIRSQD